MKKEWDGLRKQYAGIIKNLLNNIDICNERYVRDGNEGYMFAKEKYVKELKELKTFIKKEEKRLGCY